jgi:hypothetical protein
LVSKHGLIKSFIPSNVDVSVLGFQHSFLFDDSMYGGFDMFTTHRRWLEQRQCWQYLQQNDIHISLDINGEVEATLPSQDVVSAQVAYSS